MHDVSCSEHWGTPYQCNVWCRDDRRKAHDAAQELAGYWRCNDRRLYEAGLRARVERDRLTARAA